MPHALRWVLFLPRGPHSAANLQHILQPRGGERVLEIGPGVGIHSIPIAAALAPDGVLEALDAQPKMLADLSRRAAAAGVHNVTATPGDAQHLPYPDRAFDAAYLIGVLGEIPDRTAALRELHRVLKPKGRLVVGEVVLDPDYVPLGTLRKLAAEAGFVFERHRGPWFSYFARFRSESGPPTP